MDGREDSTFLSNVHGPQRIPPAPVGEGHPRHLPRSLLPPRAARVVRVSFLCFIVVPVLCVHFVPNTFCPLLSSVCFMVDILSH